MRWYFCDIVSAWLLPTPNCSVLTSSSGFELFLWLLKCPVSLLETISIRWLPHLILLIQHEPFHIHHFSSYISIYLKVEAKSVSFWLCHFTSICLMWSKWLVLDFSVALSATCGSSESSFAASNIFTQAFNLATSAANWILWVSNSNDCLLCMYSDSAISSTTVILSWSAFFSLYDLLLDLSLDVQLDCADPLLNELFIGTDC